MVSGSKFLLSCTAALALMAVGAVAQEGAPGSQAGGVPAPFGHTLFEGRPSASAAAISDPSRLIGYGDRLLLRMWGALEYEKIIMVDAEGRIFIPEVGPVTVANKIMKEAQVSVSSAVSGVYRENVNVHVSLADVNPISVFVMGNVLHPGRYEGGQTDTVLDYIIRAGGIVGQAGSYRDIDIKRNTFLDAEYDFYDLLLNGDMLGYSFQNGDTIVVRPIGDTVAVMGGTRHDASFEMENGRLRGSDLVAMSAPLPGTSHVRVARSAADADKEIYVTLDDFLELELQGGDRVTFQRDAASASIGVTIEGDVEGRKTYVLKRGASLKELLSFVAVDAGTVDLKSVHIERPSVAQEQKRAMQESLRRLQQDVLSQRSMTGTEASVRAAEAELVQAFVESAASMEFEGKVVLAREGEVSDIRLQDGDRVIIPRKSDVVYLNGEVVLGGNAILFEPGLRVKDYVQMAGGLTANADPERFVISHANGSASISGADAVVRNGDRVIAMPKVDNKTVLRSKEMIGILYQLAIGTGTLLAL
jgi:protein involved in polysaccharide export with SLBB domain